MARRLWIWLLLIAPAAWCQPLSESEWQAKGRQLLNQLRASNVSMQDAEQNRHLKAFGQALTDRQWADAYREAQWLGDPAKATPRFQVILGSMQFSALGTSADPGAAVALWKRAAEDGETDAMTMLGWVYDQGPAGFRDPNQAFHWYQMAAERGEIRALKYIARSGKALSSEQESDRWLADFANGPKAAQDPDAQRMAALWKSAPAEDAPAVEAFNQGHYDTALAAARPLADRGDAFAQTLLGLMQFEGKGAPMNFAKATEFLKPAAESGSPLAQYLLGLCYYRAFGAIHNLTLAEQYLRPLAEANWRTAQYMLAKVYQAQQKTGEADPWLLAAADQGFRQAQFEYAQMMLARSNKAEALRWYVKLAQQGELYGARYTGHCYSDPVCTTTNPAEAFRWTERAAIAGDLPAQYDLATFYLRGTGHPADPAQAARWFRAAADRDDARAQNEIGELYRLGKGVPANKAEAAKWFLRAERSRGFAAANNLSPYPRAELYESLTAAEKSAADQSLATWVKRYPNPGTFSVLAPSVVPAFTPPAPQTNASPLADSMFRASGVGSAAVPGGVVGGVPGGVLGGIIGGIPSAAPPPPPPPPPRKAEVPPPSDAIRVAGKVMEAKLVRRPIPVYPPVARQARIQGTVKLSATISKAGTVENLNLISGHALLVDAAVEAVKQWVYQPTLMNGQPVAVMTEIDVNFVLEGTDLKPLGCDGNLRTESRQSAPVNVTFRNESTSDVTVDWIDSQGEIKAFRTLAPGQQYTQSTYQGHVWMIAGGSGACLAYFQAGSVNATAVFRKP